MKKSIIALALVAFLWNSNTANAQKKSTPTQDIKVGIDLVDVKDDKVKVTVQAPKIKSDKITYSIPKIVPGTYSEDNYGKNIEDLKAFEEKLRGPQLLIESIREMHLKSQKTIETMQFKLNEMSQVKKNFEKSK
jgi:hypothetical protein